MKLYELTEAFEKIRELLIEEAGASHDPEIQEVTFEDVANEAMESYGMDIKMKIESVCIIIQELESQATRRKEESKRLGDSAKRISKQADRLRAYLRMNMPSSKVTTERFDVTVCNKSKAALVLTGEVPEGFLMNTVTTKPNNGLIREQLEGGAELSFAKLSDDTTYLRIK